MRIPDTPPKIKPADPGRRAKWSVMIPVYNCSKYLPELLYRVLPQITDDMQIEVVDDCSTDADVGNIVSRIGKGRIGYFRQDENVGSLRNFETCINRAYGEYVHLLHGDDRLLPGYYEHMTKTFEMFPEIGAAFCAHDHVDSDGNLRRFNKIQIGEPYVVENWLEMEAEKQRTQYVAMVVKRSVYEKLGGFFGVTYGEDWEMWTRIGKYYPVAFIPRILAQYREHDESISGYSYATGKNLKDIMKVIDTINHYLPEQKRKSLKAAARKNYAYYAVNRKSYLWKKNHRHPPGVNFFLAVIRMHLDLKLTGKMIKLAARVQLHQVFSLIETLSLKPHHVWKASLSK